MIEGHNICVRSPDGRTLLKGVDFKLLTGKRLAFSGPNGCGKSTLLRAIAGLEEDSFGIIRRIAVDQMSYVPTRPLDLLLPWGTVRESIDLFYNLALNRGVAYLSINNDYGKSLGYDLSPMADREVYKLSSGQQAILAIFCALIQKPEVLVADEIFSTLSEKLRLSLASAIKETGITLVCATHDSDFIDAIDAQVIQLDDHVV